MICVSISQGTKAEVKEILKQVELAELRLDLLGFEPDEIEPFFDTSCRIIATCRKDGVDAEKRKQLLETAVDNGAHYIDIDIAECISNRNDPKENLLDHFNTLKDEAGFQLIISYHNYDQTPGEEELNAIVQACLSKGAHITKVACQINNPLDNLRLLKLLDRPERVVVAGMGKHGKVSRLASLELGAPFTYASWKVKEETAEGQMTIDEMKEVRSIMRGTSVL